MTTGWHCAQNPLGPERQMAGGEIKLQVQFQEPGQMNVTLKMWGSISTASLSVLSAGKLRTAAGLSSLLLANPCSA